MDRWQQVEKICQSALELEESRRGAFLEQACGGDEGLRREVESLLRFESREEGFIEKPAFEVAAKMIAEDKPESLVGRQLGSYQILSLLGAGGMGVVYKARDTRLNRSVAVKVLPSDKVSDPDRKRRFVQEARAASALNHPNIITLHDVGSEAGVDYIVMECVSGQTLDRLIPRKGMRLSEALKVAVPMADALAKAHASGIVHRDLKPTNVMVTEEGVVKVLDFGLAKLSEVESGDAATSTLEPRTDQGTIVGTLSYMSPEQAEGRRVDSRSDIFSFGSVLYEMLSGQKPFQGDSKLSTLAAIVKEEPKPISQVVPGISPDWERTIQRCLRKDPERRFQHMADIKVTLHELREDMDTLAGRPASRTSPLQAQRLWRWAGAAFAVVAIAIAGWLFRSFRKPQAALEVVPLTSYEGVENFPSFSPDGDQVAFSWNGESQDNQFDIYLKLIGSPTPVRLTTDPANDVSPAFSPDGHSIGFVRVWKERAAFIIIPAIGGPERPVADVPVPQCAYPSFAWLPDGKSIVTDGLALLSTDSGEIRGLTSTPPNSFDFSPAVSPDGRAVAFSRLASYPLSDIYLLDLTQDLKPKGEPRRLTSLQRSSFRPAWTPNGREIIFASGDYGRGGSLWRVPVSSNEQPEQLPFGEASWPAISHSGSRLVYQKETNDLNVWRLPLSGPGVASGAPARFISSTRHDSAAQYSPDGKRIAFESNRTGVYGIWVSNADSSNAVELISQAGAGSESWSPDGQRIAFHSNTEGNFNIYVIRASGGKPIRLTTDPAEHVAGGWSRDGKWIYFSSNRTGRHEVWKVPAGRGDAIQVTHNGGGTAFESPDGKFIYYIKGKTAFSGSLWKMPVDGGEEIQVLPSVGNRTFFVINQGIYFIPEPGINGKSSIQFLSFATNKAKTVTSISRLPWEGLSVSPDGRFILFTQVDEAGSDVMLVENFR